MAEVEVISEKLSNSTIVENGKPDDYWGFPLHEAFRMAIKFYKGIVETVVTMVFYLYLSPDSSN